MSTSNLLYQSVIAAQSLENIYIKQTFDYYRQRYLGSLRAQRFVAISERLPNELRDHDMPCLCDRTLGFIIPKRRSLEGGALRGALQRVGLLIATGGELFRGCIVFPTIDEYQHVISAIGYRYGTRIRHWQQPVVHWERPTPSFYISQGESLVEKLLYGKATH